MAAIWTIIPGLGIAAITNYFMEKCVDIILHLPYSRKLELEADAVGLELAAKACFDVRESYAYWSKMALKSKITGEVEIPDVLSTHPSHGDRAERLDLLVPKCLDIRAHSECPPLRALDPRGIADARKRMIEGELALQGKF